MCVFAIRATAGVARKGSNLGKERKDTDAVAAGDGSRGILVRSTSSTVNVVWMSTALQPFTMELPWTTQWFNISGFSQEYAMKKSKVHEYERTYSMLVLCTEVSCTS